MKRKSRVFSSLFSSEVFNLLLWLLIKFIAAEMGADQPTLRHKTIQVLTGLCPGAMTEADVDLLGQVGVLI